ncbi:hypothetical protein SAMN04515656_11231 [Eubacterium aggregans]|uniref:Uncharacterized protein n=1 Tax=Eubacterium aggregans TaxID=81409 RepID=A0A1H4BPV7_9FIRM|nr:hypothetical protein [Eubacterium aggregans]SEA50186.1 hypothetical protein SAMN04515656_11231 [Eubacterium aggregans]
MEKRKNPYGLEEEKLEWLESIGAKAFDKPMIYYTNEGIGGSQCLFSRHYIESTPIEVLRSDFKKFVKEECSQ